MPQPTNPFTDQPITEGIISGSGIRDREKLGLSETTVAVRLPRFNNPNELIAKYIEWDFLQNNLENEEYKKIKHLIQGLWLNGYPLVEGREVISLELLQKKLASAPLPRTPKEKLDNLLLHIVRQQQEDGATVSVDTASAYIKLYFKSKAEVQFYLTTLKDDGLIDIPYILREDSWDMKLTFKGLSYAASLENEGPNSNLCFIAISFADEMAARRDAIISIIKHHGYEPIIVNSDFIVKNDQPVIDEILAGIKRAKFCIADFTMQRAGVYFEAGYALGLGRSVIYLSERQDFEEHSHFDLRPFQHILYSNEEELRSALSVKIAAWIGSKRPEYNAIKG